jgi:biotin operon repressor
MIQDPDVLMADMGVKLRSCKQGKPDMVRRVIHFLEYLNHAYGADIDLSPFKYYIWEDQDERILTMLKYVHDKMHSRQEIADALGVTLRMLNDDIKLLKDGYSFLGTEIKIDESKKGDFGSHVHPVFLALNTADIFELTVGLSMMSQHTVFESRTLSLVGQIISQLSPEIMELMDNQANLYQVDMQAKQPRFENTLQMMNRNNEQEKPFTYFLREPMLCVVTYRKKGREETVTGIMKIADPHPGGFRKVSITNEDKTTILDMDEVIGIRKL